MGSLALVNGQIILDTSVNRTEKECQVNTTENSTQTVVRGCPSTSVGTSCLDGLQHLGHHWEIPSSNVPRGIDFATKADQESKLDLYMWYTQTLAMVGHQLSHYETSEKS